MTTDTKGMGVDVMTKDVGVAYVAQKRFTLFGETYERGDQIPSDAIANWRTLQSYLGTHVITIPSKEVVQAPVQNESAATQAPEVHSETETSTPTPTSEEDDEPSFIDESSEEMNVSSDEEMDEWLRSQGVEISPNGWYRLPNGETVRGRQKAFDALDTD